MVKGISVAALAMLFTVSLGADVKITSTTTGKMMGQGGTGETVQYIKGAKMRADTKMGGDAISTIYDVDTQRMIVLNHKKKEAEVFSIQDLASQVKAIGEADIKVQVTPTGQTKPCLDQTCDGYDIQISVAFSPIPDQPMTMIMGGPAWIAKNAPGRADLTAFYTAASEKGFIFSDPRVAKAQPGQAKGMAAFYKSMADAGVPYATEMQIKIEGSGMMAAMMSKMGGSSFTTTVTAISTDPIGADMFEVPAGYQTKTR
jgi:hypothetical protein